MTELARCACGQVPTALAVVEVSEIGSPWRRFVVAGGCCCWAVTGGHAAGASFDIEKSAEKAWNAAPRGGKE